MSEGSEEGDEMELVSKQWAGDQKWDGSLGWSRVEEGCGLMWELRESSDDHWKGNSRSSYKA